MFSWVFFMFVLAFFCQKLKTVLKEFEYTTQNKGYMHFKMLKKVLCFKVYQSTYHRLIHANKLLISPVCFFVCPHIRLNFIKMYQLPAFSLWPCSLSGFLLLLGLMLRYFLKSQMLKKVTNRKQVLVLVHGTFRHQGSYHQYTVVSCHRNRFIITFQSCLTGNTTLPC